MTQRALVVLALVAGAVAGILYWSSAQRIAVVVAGTDLAPGRAIAAVDLETRALPPEAVPSGAITDMSAALGRYVRAPLSRGQLLLAGAIAAMPASFETGIALPTGYRAVAVPVTPAQAVGGAVLPGARVDVIAVPIPGRAPAGRSAELLATAALVVDVRGEQGGAFERQSGAKQTATAMRDRLGSVVIAVGPAAEMWIADRMGTSTFVVALVHDRP